jgi:hypothetical protein
MSEGKRPTNFVWKTLPYGYTRAPYIAKAIIKPLVAKWRRLGASVVVFYDDGMAVSDDPVFLKNMAVQMQCDLINAGLVPGVDKCIWTPVTVIHWNGLKFDLAKQELSILPRRVEKVLSLLDATKKKFPKVTYREIAKVTGSINSMAPVFEGNTQIHTKMLQLFVNIRHFESKSWDSFIESDCLTLFAKAYEEIEFWQKHTVTGNMRPFNKPNPTWLAWTDASDYALGGFVAKTSTGKNAKAITADNLLLKPNGVYKKLRSRVQLQADAWRSNTLTVRDMFDLDIAEVEQTALCHRPFIAWESAADSNERELIAILYVVEHCSNLFENSKVTLHTDNQNAAIICTKGSNKFRLNRYARQISELCLAHKIQLSVNWIPRDLNILADAISNSQDFTDYSVTTDFFDMVSSDMGVTPLIDLFANNENTKCTRFFSLSYAKDACGVDAFNYNWKLYGLGWIFVPPNMIMRALNHLEITGSEALVLVPQWKTSYFYPRLLALKRTSVFQRKFTYSGKNVFKFGNDLRSYFGPHFQANVEVWYLNFDK